MTATTLRSGRRTAAATGLVLSLAGFVQGCAAPSSHEGAFVVRETTPAFLLSVDARDPSMAADGHGNVALTWVSGDSLAGDAWLSVSRDSGITFSPPARVNAIAGRVVSSLEGRPAVALGAEGAIAIAWSEWRADSSGAIDLRLRAGDDLGRTLRDPATVNDDGGAPPPGLRWRELRDWPLKHRPNATHGMPAIAFTNDGALLAAWLDDRRTPVADSGRVTTLWTSLSHDGGLNFRPNVALSDSALPRSRPALAIAAGGTLALTYHGTANGRQGHHTRFSADGLAFGGDTLLTRENRLLAATGRALTLPDGSHWVGTVAPVAMDNTRYTFEVSALIPAGAALAPARLGADVSAIDLAAAGRACAIACWLEHEPGHTRLRLATLTRRSRRSA